MMSRVSLILGVVTALVALLGGVQWVVGEYRAWSWRRKQTGKWLVLIGVCLLPSISEATCSGSGTAWTCTTAGGYAKTDLDTVVSNATDGATVTYSAGTYTHNGFTNFSNSKGITIICESAGSCTFSGGSFGMGMAGTMASGTNTKLYRISGFVLPNNQGMFWFYSNTGIHATLTSVRIDHNTFNCAAEKKWFQLGVNDAYNFIYGVFDHNTITGSTNCLISESYGPNSISDHPAGTAGTANNMYFEDNSISFTNMGNAGTGCIDAQYGSGMVFRFNTVANCLVTQHGVYDTSWGPVNMELYGNQLEVNSASDTQYHTCYRCFHHQGTGEFLAFGNRFKQKSGSSHDTNALEMTHYASNNVQTSTKFCDGARTGDGNRTPTATYRGYPCQLQPGRDVNGTLRPMYVWDNFWNDDSSQVNLVLQDTGSGTNYFTEHFVNNRDYFNAVSASAQSSSSAPFDGTTGMGFGTIARRPSNCSTASTDAGDAGSGGVGYASTDEGTWLGAAPSYGNTSMAAYKLYNCGTTNTWSAYYTPYTYPHPLVGGGGSTGGSFPFLLRSWPVVIEAASAIGALYHWRGVIAGILIFLLGCGITGASMIAQTTRQTIQWTKRTSYHSAQALAQHYLDWSRKG